ncbi:hypothetical protein RAH41_08130 [Gottfriedia acidiceleris]|uniref:hypothetical protein n=1 Tax=Gottfriedia acidiceleris TaxID=371036 RepID=UPI002F2620AE
MYCPYCKEELNVKNGHLYCKNGDTYFSKHIEEAFNKKIDKFTKEKSRTLPFENSIEGFFFCVNCRNKMEKLESMHEVCHCCGFEITKGMYYAIIERHGHRSFK